MKQVTFSQSLAIMQPRQILHYGSVTLKQWKMILGWGYG